MNRPDYFLARDVGPFALHAFAYAIHNLAVCGPACLVFQMHAEVLLEGLTLQPCTLR